jgi:bile acid:Na+ symporter, BASS family
MTNDSSEHSGSNPQRDKLLAVSQFVNRNFIWLLIGAYALAACVPAAGQSLDRISLGEFTINGTTTRLCVPELMLAFLIWNAGLEIKATELKDLGRCLLALVAGVAANIAVPLALVFVIAKLMVAWPNADESQHLLVGLSLIASMPVAASSTAWTQKSGGNIALSLGIVLVSTASSPLSTPMVLHLISTILSADYGKTFVKLASFDPTGFLCLYLIAPSLLGFLTRIIAGESCLASWKPYLKLAGAIDLMVLIYVTTSQCLPLAFQRPDPPFVAVTVSIVLVVCASCFLSGWLIGKALKLEPPETATLIYGLGMNNNGAGLVFASVMMSAYPLIMLPIIIYNLMQHLAAGVIDHIFSAQASRNRSKPTPTN